MRLIAALVGITVLAAPVYAAEVPAFPAEDLEFFEKEVRPLLIGRCQKCHGAEQQKGSLRLDSRESVLQGGDTGPALVPGHPQQSELIQAINYDPSGYQMPPEGKLTAAEIAILTRWVELGAPWPAGTANAAARTAADWATEFGRRIEHWSFQPLTHPRPPAVADSSWCRTPIDRFLLSKLEAAGLPHAREADRRTWLRRVTFDVLGLAPTPAEIEGFLSDHEPGAHERVIERLLASPHFGERWGRHWLDLVRYAESRGHEFDYDVPNPWHYRDYVIRALNDDLPYNRFVVEHIAGDLLREPSAECPVSSVLEDRASSLNTGHATRDTSARLDPLTGANLSIVATGFWFFGEWVHSPVDIRQDEADRFENMIDVYSKTFLGLTVACARCHDHKFDPIPQSDFYALQGYLQSSVYAQVPFETLRHNRALADKLQALDREAAESLLPAIADVAAPALEQLDQYLLAAQDLLRESAATPAAKDSSAFDERVQAVAAQRQLDVRTLSAWVEHLRLAAEDSQDPFHEWALLTAGRLPNVAAAVQRLPAFRAGSSDQEFERDDWFDRALDEGRLFDLPEFQSDGPAFAFREFLRPVVEWTGDTSPLPGRVEEGGFFEYRPELGELPVAAGTMHDPGKLSELQRGGRSLRTPSFEITQDKLWCHIRGGGDTYVVVDSHALINGPLHGSLLKKHAAPERGRDDWRWIEHDVSRYKGRRAHLEFIPRHDEPFAVMHVVQADQRPPIDPAHRQFAPVVTSAPPASSEALAKCWQKRWAAIPQAIAWFLSPARSGSAELDTTAWACRHPQLFGLDTPAARQRFASITKPLSDRRAAVLRELRPGSALAPVMLAGTEEDEYLFIRGNWKKRGDVVPRRFLSAFSRQPSASEELQPANVGGDRLQLALQMVDPQQTPIVARVVVNRIWQHYFGRGIVPTPDDFGHLGLPPSHPELLDWLASELIAHDWSLKHVHGLILRSSAYRMASSGAEGSEPRVASDPLAQSGAPLSNLDSCHAADPGNSLLWRMNVKRLEGEIIRDAVLQLSGRLDDLLYGPSVPIHLTSFLEGRGRPGESGPVDGRGRRSLYLSVRRNFPEPFLQAFDFPNPHSTTGRRNVSNVPAQALSLMNNPLIIEQAAVWARRLLAATSGGSAEDRIRQIYAVAFARQPTDEELAAALAFLEEQRNELHWEPDDPRLWADYLHVLLNGKEFSFVR